MPLFFDLTSPYSQGQKSRKFFRCYFGINDYFIRTFWNYLTFRAVQLINLHPKKVDNTPLKITFKITIIGFSKILTVQGFFGQLHFHMNFFMSFKFIIISKTFITLFTLEILFSSFLFYNFFNTIILICLNSRNFNIFLVFNWFILERDSRMSGKNLLKMALGETIHHSYECSPLLGIFFCVKKCRTLLTVS